MGLYPDSPTPMSYAAGLADFSGIGNLPSDYYKTQEQKRQYDANRVFQNGFPIKPDGSPNTAAIIDAAARYGGVNFAQQLLPMIIQQDMSAQGANNLSDISSSLYPGNAAPRPQGAAPQASSDQSEPRGVRNSNFGNIKDGSFAQSQPGYAGSDGTFAKFETPEHGIQAATTLLGRYGQAGINTIQGVIQRWAPAGADGNNPAAYAATVSKALGIAPDAPIDLTDPQVRGTLARAMFTVENGKPVGQSGGATAFAAPERPAIPPHGIPQGEPSGEPRVMNQNGPAQPDAQGVYGADAVMMPPAPVRVAGPAMAAASSPSAAPGPATAQPSPEAPPQPQAGAQPQAAPQASAPALGPEFLKPEVADRFDIAASRAVQEARRIGKFDQTGATAALKQAEFYAATAKLIREKLADANMPTGEMKNSAASGGLNPLQFENAKIVAKVSAENSAQTPEQKLYEQAKQQGYNGTEMQFAQERERLKVEAGAPYKIAEMAVREGGRPLAIKPNEVVTTGSQVNPALEHITGWAAGRLGIPTTRADAPAAGNQPAATGVEGQSQFTPRIIKNPDGSVASTVTPSTEVLQSTAAKDYEEARHAYKGAQQVKVQLASMEDSFRGLNAANWSSTGAGAEAKLKFANAVNSVWQTLGVPDQKLPFDPEKIADWQKLAKDTTRLGFALSKTLGSREAMQIVQGAIAANPNIANTPLGAKMVLNAIRENAQRDSDYFEYATKYAPQHGGDLFGAEVEFNKLNKPEIYARRAIVQAQKDIPYEAIEQLRSNPKLAADFDKHYKTPGAAKLFLGNTGQ